MGNGSPPSGPRFLNTRLGSAATAAPSGPAPSPQSVVNRPDDTEPNRLWYQNRQHQTEDRKELEKKHSADVVNIVTN